jgi:adenylosuccinate lyase
LADATGARPVIYLGATSCYVFDNTDLIQFRASMQRRQRKVVKVLATLKTFTL